MVPKLKIEPKRMDSKIGQIRYIRVLFFPFQLGRGRLQSNAQRHDNSRKDAKETRKNLSSLREFKDNLFVLTQIPDPKIRQIRGIRVPFF
ncbi:MAG: hypothetical protein R3D55_06405 [Chloroflexota bacterium]